MFKQIQSHNYARVIPASGMDDAEYEMYDFFFDDLKALVQAARIGYSCAHHIGEHRMFR